MNLQLCDWKDALEKHGIGCNVPAEFRPSGPILVTDCGHLQDVAPDDHNAATFISRTTSRVFGPWAYYCPLSAIGDPVLPELWALQIWNSRVVGFGLTKLDALFDALTKTPSGRH